MENNFKFEIGERVVVCSPLSIFHEKECIINERWYSERSKVNKYHVFLGGCTYEYFWEKGLEKLNKNII